MLERLNVFLGGCGGKGIIILYYARRQRSTASTMT